ncbi:MAG: ATP-binding response regulator [Pseudobacter sp.]|uniref:ATP-binding response regulator n=1 Tax=Pseudobacter sp. TaxID=2045420 RepID=UPI003F81B29B
MDEDMLLEVKDDGPGIPKASQQRIFERFYQAQHNVQGGTGIGLALVKEFTTLMNGATELQSHPGDTRFRVKIPVQRVPAAIATTSPAVKSPEPASGNEYAPLVLIVEDNQELRSFLADSMRTSYRVLEASNGAKAWDTVLRELPELVISDVMMSEKDGFDLCQQMKADPRTAHTGFILLTSMKRWTGSWIHPNCQ